MQHWQTQGVLTEERCVWLLGSSVQPSKGKVQFPDADSILAAFQALEATRPDSRPTFIGSTNPTLSNRRLRQGYPIYIPDTPFHRAMADLGFTHKLADTVDRNTFVTDWLPRVQVIFPRINIQSIFLHPKEDWD